MPQYRAPLDDIRFVLEEVIDVEQLSRLPGHEEATPEVLLAVLEEGATLCEEVLAPINQSGDAEGTRFENGQVRTPAGFREAYRKYVDGGWASMTARPEHGGQGLPHVARFVFEEMLCSANLSFAMYPGLAQGAYDCVLHNSRDEELHRRYLPNLATGEWGGTMCLTEPHAGTDLGIIRTRAVPAGDGAYQVTGTKIFITSGDHDMTENIVHLVLAKLPDAPPGTRGISLFLVPKYLPTDDGRPGTPNGVSCGSIEHKMGIKGSATCVMNYDGARGWLVGEPHAGLKAMFLMMNGARLGVGIQGLGLSEVSYQNAVVYARDRVQGRSLKGAQFAEKEADPIIVHPDVRRMLMTMRAYVEGGRALAYWVGMLIDVAERHEGADEKQAADDLVALMTPVVKAFLTDNAFEVTNLGVQTLGGHGYIREYGMEQFVRDARIGQIYEGTNGIQALDLVGRKLSLGSGRLVKRFLALVQQELDGAQQAEALRPLAAALAESLGRLQKATLTVAARGTQNPEEAGAVAADYLRLFGLVSVGYMWLRMARVAAEKLPAAGARAPFYEAKLTTARFYMAKILPQTRTLAATIEAGAEPVMALAAEAF
ncbi:MAG: Long chain acyl-CoA dehydrogenase [fadN-fadA-fadE operon] [uncultured Gemmatimonadaceae bacterium]|uniref:3-methylmercaptopropionyl-CoA dehydrogenase n=1 Tax=uncultured Gemmatimonadaceae bacterium TaxID=246130 RepID=A0A6J4LEX8_9BACT|nr:MAG: Long chain acyl-CoA dehydrogenase [fadN-fadA-fadE operon] [uncultured Gemmatimonadaceae bacterium]